MTSIFVAKLDFGVTSEDLKNAFQEFGTVLKATVATDKETGKSRGFGFVEMANQDEAAKAIDALDGSTLNGRQIAVKEAEQRNDNRGGQRDNNFKPRDNNFQPRDNNFKPRDNNSGSNYKGQNNRNEGGFTPRENESFPRKANDENASTGIPFELPKNDLRSKKSDKDKDKKKSIDDDKSKKTKLNPYKKSGKNNRFFEDDDDDFDPNTASLFNYDDEDDDWDSDEEDDDED